jgi:hypothetical protein
MSLIITQPGAPAQVHPDEAARKRAERLARATPEQAEAALAFLSVIDPLIFGIAMDAVDQTAAGAPEEEQPADQEPVPVCRSCGGQVGIFLDHGLDWEHFRGDGTTSGAQEIYDPGHPAEVTWRLPDEEPQEP